MTIDIVKTLTPGVGIVIASDKWDDLPLKRESSYDVSLEGGKGKVEEELPVRNTELSFRPRHSCHIICSQSAESWTANSASLPGLLSALSFCPGSFPSTHEENRQPRCYHHCPSNPTD